MRVITKRIIDLTPQEYRDCYRLNLRDNGQMQSCLAEAKRYEQSYHKRRRFSHAIMIKDGDRLLAWSLVMPMHGERGWEAQFYTRKAERNKGLGTVLFKEVQKFDKRPYVIPWSKPSGEFFKKHRKFIKFDPWQASWLK